jgi:Tfp pilus assembly protein PilV
MTLIEVMIAMLLGSVALMGALAMVGTLTRGGSYSRQLSEASAVAQSKLEEQVVLTPMPADGITPGDTLPVNAFGVATGNPDAFYTRTTTWSTFPDTNTSATRRLITVTVQWKDPLGGDHTLVAKRERVP